MLKVERWNLIIQSIDLIDTTNVNGCNRNYHILDDQKCSLNFDCSKNKKKVMVWLIYLWVRLTCALRAHIKLSIFRNLFSGIEKAVITFSILEKFFSKNGN